MTPEEEREHQTFMDKINKLIKNLYEKNGMHQPAEPQLPDYAPEQLTYYEDATAKEPFHLDSVPVSPPSVKADTKHVPNTLRDMVEGK